MAPKDTVNRPAQEGGSEQHGDSLVSPASQESTSAASSDELGSRKHLVPLSCSQAFDSLYFCYSPFHQGKIYYQSGELDDCRGRLKRLRLCALSRFKSYEDSEKMYEEAAKAEPQKPPPVWELRPEYIERVQLAEEQERKEEGHSDSGSVDGWWI